MPKYKIGDKVRVHFKARGKLIANIHAIPELLQNDEQLYCLSISSEDFLILITGVPEKYLFSYSF